MHSDSGSATSRSSNSLGRGCRLATLNGFRWFRFSHGTLANPQAIGRSSPQTRQHLMIFKRALWTIEVGKNHKDASQHVKAVTSLKVTRKELFRCYRNLVQPCVWETPVLCVEPKIEPNYKLIEMVGTFPEVPKFLHRRLWNCEMVSGKFKKRPMNFAESLKQLLWKSHQLIALQLQISEFPETVEEAIGQSGEPVATQVQLQQAPLEVMKDLWR